eukprot:TRINITY_DN4389_c0_g1_i1.p1 TRINITY_DN4389_c0_g1~~TRINITY_DN4389_c0_g1_i1.p1  ORF type:complete len:223 (-),score=30.15 TRINITY_DN4389_c0_g1_i1:294-962(-)
MAWTADDEWFKKNRSSKYTGPMWLPGRDLVPGVLRAKVQNPVGADLSMLCRDLQDFFLPLLAFHGIVTWQQAALLTVMSPCFKGVPPELVIRFLATLRPLHPEAAAAPCAEEVALLLAAAVVGVRVATPSTEHTARTSNGAARIAMRIAGGAAAPRAATICARMLIAGTAMARHAHAICSTNVPTAATGEACAAGATIAPRAAAACYADVRRATMRYDACSW